MEKRLWVSERKLKSCIQAGELADKYEQARRKDTPLQQKCTKIEGVKCHYCAKIGHLEKKYISLQETRKSCISLSREDRSWLSYDGSGVNGSDGKTIQLQILPGTACSATMVMDAGGRSSDYVDAVLMGTPLAQVCPSIGGKLITVKAAESDTLQVAVLLGTDVKELSQLLGQETWMTVR